MQTNEIVMSILREKPLTVPEIWQATQWKVTVPEIAEALDDLRRDGKAACVPIHDAGGTYPAWKAVRA